MLNKISLMQDLPLLMHKKDSHKHKFNSQLLKINSLLLKITKEKLTKILEPHKLPKMLLKINTKDHSLI